jgi:DNA ligase-1
MQHAAHVIQALERTNSRLEKEAIIQQAWDLNILEFFVGARLALDALNTFGVQKVPQVSDPNQTGTYSWAHFASLTSALSARTLTGHAARDAIQQAADSCDQITWNFWYRRLLLKDLKCGTSETTINKVLLRNGGKALSYQVPVFSCQLAKNADDHAKKMKGIKLCDFKLDGFRCLTVLYPSGKVEQFTRNGLSNTNFGHICEQLKPVAQSLDQPWVFDGEMISENFQTLMTQVNRKDNVNTSDSTLVLFDCVPLAEFQKGAWNVSQRDRLKQLHEWAPMLTHVSLGVVKVAEQVEVNLDTPEGQDRLTQFNQQALALKLEGIMI